ncbi:MAG: hypothetical protein PHV74_02520 [Dehalococcoidia bacterium]|nr:hypothetical protein [Dehalococcoidia bacterium]
MKRKKIILATMLTVACVLVGALATLAMSSPNHDLSWDALSGGGAERSSASYRLGDTVGQSSAIGSSQSTNYRLGAGFWYGVPVEASVEISVILQGSSRLDAGWEIPLTVKFLNPETSSPVYEFYPKTSKDGSVAVCTVNGVAPGTYDITVDSGNSLTGDSGTTLQNINYDVVISASGMNVNMGTLLEGDANNDGTIDGIDFGILQAKFMTSDPAADFDRNGIVDISDLGLLAVNFMKTSPVEVP